MREIFLPENPELNKRIAMVVEYDGNAYNGWQFQKTGVPTIQGELNKAIARVANHPVKLVCAGRTDAGVHACRQIIHFDTDATRKDFGWTVGTNTNLPRDISVQWAKEMDHHFHARFSCIERRYRYVIYNEKIPPGIMRKGMTWERRPLDSDKMSKAAQYLLGEHDFSSFRAVDCQAASPVKNIKSVSLKRLGKMIVIDIRANSFLYHMVRNIAGTLIEVGVGDKTIQWFKEVIDAKSREAAGVTALPNGLYFVDAIYGSEFKLPETGIGPNFLSWLD